MMCSKCHTDFRDELQHGLMQQMFLPLDTLRKLLKDRGVDKQAEFIKVNMETAIRKMTPFINQHSAICKACWDKEWERVCRAS